MKHFADIEYSQSLGITQEANVLNLNFTNAYNMFVGNSVFLTRKIENEKFRHFLNLRDKWKSEIRFISSGSLIISNSAYKEIIEFGPIAIPWIIREVKKRNDHWFFALEKITGANPIREENVGKIEDMSKDWIEWAEENNYL